jgi:tungstate transport system ATP-binding protein
MAQFNLTSVKKYYGSRIALDLEELTLWPGRLYVLTGPNGSGKSTLLSILAFLAKPDQGDMLFAQDRVTWRAEQLSVLRRKVTLLQQSPYLFGGTVCGNVAFGLKTRGFKSLELQRAVSDSLKLVGLTGFEHRKIGQLSGGEAQRVALARALALKPEVLLLDEPLANVDKTTASILEPLIASLPSQGTTVVMSTHDPHLGRSLNGHVLRLLDGRLEPMASQFKATDEFIGEGASWSRSKMHVN